MNLSRPNHIGVAAEWWRESYGGVFYKIARIGGKMTDAQILYIVFAIVVLAVLFAANDKQGMPSSRRSHKGTHMSQIPPGILERDRHMNWLMNSLEEGADKLGLEGEDRRQFISFWVSRYDDRTGGWLM
jgi:hypothetical protein